MEASSFRSTARLPASQQPARARARAGDQEGGAWEGKVRRTKLLQVRLRAVVGTLFGATFRYSCVYEATQHKNPSRS